MKLMATYGEELFDHPSTSIVETLKAYNRHCSPNNEGLYGLSLRNMNLCSADLKGIALSCASIDMSELDSVNLNDAVIGNTTMTYTRLNAALVRRAYFHQCRLHSVDCKHADFRHTGVSYTSLYYVDGSNTDFRYTRWSDSSLHYVDFSNADLRYATFSDVSLSAVTLTNAQIADNVFVRDYTQIANIGSRNATLTAFFCTNSQIYVTTGCFFGTLEAFEEAVYEKYPHPSDKYHQQYTHAIQFLRDVAQ
jgi:uncharacterized protein YjbI with pentapeptide repeats